MQFNKIIVCGYLGRDAETNDGKMKTARFSLALSEGKDDKKVTTWLNVTAFDKTAEFATNFKKGDNVFVEGRIRENRWTDKNGQEKVTLQVLADRVWNVPKAAKQDNPFPDAPQSSWDAPKTPAGSLDDIPF